MKKFLAVAVVTLLSLSTMAGCSSQSTSTSSSSSSSSAASSENNTENKKQDGYKVAYLTPSMDVPFWRYVAIGIENKAKELHFNSANEWLYTTWDVREREIQDIATKVQNDNPGFKIDDIDYKESADGSEVYIFELEKGNQEIHVTVDMEGNVVK